MTERRPTDHPPLGYAALVERLGLEVIPNWHRSVLGNSTREIHHEEGTVREVFPASYAPGETLGDHLEFALKYDGTNLALLERILTNSDPQEILEYVRSKPTGKYSRRLWHLYERMTGVELPLDDLDRGSYVDLIDEKEQYVTRSARRVRRQRINDNLLGDGRFCPTVRRTGALRDYEATEPSKRCRAVLDGYSEDLLRRAASYLYSKETEASFEIESETPSQKRSERFIALLKLAEREDFCVPSRLVELQHRIVDERFQADGYRDFQNYVGETISIGRERVHCAFPKPEDIQSLMDGLVASNERMSESLDSALVHAACVAFGFVFLHPFEDGNGRIHRFLIHNVLARRGFTPEGIIFPVSAAMLHDPRAYDASLEAFSLPLMEHVEYALDAEGRMVVTNDTATWYRYPDLTHQAEALSEFIDRTIDTELVEELDFLAGYDRARSTMRDLVDLPNRLADLFIKCCLQNQGRLSQRKRDVHFDQLTGEEVAALERAVQQAYGVTRAD